MNTIAQLKTRFEYAKRRRQKWDGLYSECYRYAIPHRDTWYGGKEGRPQDGDIYDSTAIDSTVNFANMLHESLTPPEFRWFRFAPGSDVPHMEKERVQSLLDAVTERWFQLLWQTNFDTEINQSYQDLAVGTASLGIRDYDDPQEPATFVAVPPKETYMCEGRQGFIDTVFREFELEPRQIKANWPRANFDETQYVTNIRANGADNQGKLTVIEATYYDYMSRKAQYVVWLGSEDKEILRKSLLYNNWITFRWNVVSGEIMGRGPLINALYDIKTLNKGVELVLKNASIAVSGIYTAVDDGVLNPETIELAPGIIIPVGANGGNFGRSLDVLPRSGDFSVAELVFPDLQQSIRRKLFDDDLAPLDDAVRSSREVAMRQARLARKAGPNFGRMKTELIGNFVRSTTDMWIAKGLLPPFQIDGKLITIVHQSPIAQQQAEEDMLSMDKYLARLNAHTPGLATAVVKPDEYAHYIAEKSGIPMKLIASRQEIQQISSAVTEQIANNTEAGKAAVQAFTQ